MAKRSSFPRNPRDLYPTPSEAIPDLLPHLIRLRHDRFVEPCAADGAFARRLVHFAARYGHDMTPVSLSDIHPLAPDIAFRDARTALVPRDAVVVTNPPWDFSLLAPILERLAAQAPTWLLLPLDFAANARSAPFMARCSIVQPTRRLRWVPGSDHSDTNYAAWYLFGPGVAPGGPRLSPRVPAPLAELCKNR